MTITPDPGPLLEAMRTSSDASLRRIIRTAGHHAADVHDATDRTRIWYALLVLADQVRNHPETP